VYSSECLLVVSCIIILFVSVWNCSLPDELVLKILDYLTPADLLSSACVCKRWLSLTNDKLVITSLCLATMLYAGSMVLPAFTCSCCCCSNQPISCLPGLQQQCGPMLGQTDRPPYHFIDPAPHNVRAVLISYTKQDAVMCVVFVIHFF